MTRFIHTGDWQIGMTRHFLDDDAQARYTAARLDAIRSIGELAEERQCEFVIVSGDVFESNYLDRRDITRALEAMRDCPVPIYLLPGNHDPLDNSAIYRSPTFVGNRPDHLHVIESSSPIDVDPGVQIVGAPWFSKRPTEDLVAKAIGQLQPTTSVIRILVGHGAVDAISPNRDDPASISLSDMEDALEKGVVHYVALGDRHSLTSVGHTGRVRYAGTPEPTAFNEVDPGKALVVDLNEHSYSADPVNVGTWMFTRREFNLSGTPDLDLLESWLDERDNKDRRVVRLDLAGSLSISDKARLDSVLERFTDLFPSIETRHGDTGLSIVPDDTDFSELELTGFAANALEELREIASGHGGDSRVAQDALSLLYRLSRGEA